MKKNLLLISLLIATTIFGQFDFYGPKTFKDILLDDFNTSWTPSPISNIESRKYVSILDQATQSKVVMINSSDISLVEFNSLDNINGSNATYGSAMQSVFQIIDNNAQYENDPNGGSGNYTPLNGNFRINPFLHSYYGLNSNDTNSVTCTNGGSYYISEETSSGFVLVNFSGTASSTKIIAVAKYEYDIATESLVEVQNWTPKYMVDNGTSINWSTDSADASNFYLADANSLLNLTIENGSDFNPNSIPYQPNASASIQNVEGIEDSKLITTLPNKLNLEYKSQLGSSASATASAIEMLDAIETDLTTKGSKLRYPKQFYLNLRENMLSHKITSSDIFNGKIAHNNIQHIYFTNATDNSGIPHPFMVISAFSVSTRPNLLTDVNRPPGASPGNGYAQSEVTRNAKIGDLLVKIPLKDYGLINTLTENDLSPYNDLASDFDSRHGTTTTKDVYNYTSLTSCAIAVDGVPIYPAYNNNLVFTVENAEITSSGIHVGGGLALHYHADGHAFNGNGFNLYNLGDYIIHDHPPIIGIANDGIALFGKYELFFSSMNGYGIALDEYGGHDHNDGFGYHYHAFTKNINSNPNFHQHFLMVGAWKGNINSIPGFDKNKLSQFADDSIARYVGASYTLSTNKFSKNSAIIYPNPSNGLIKLSIENKAKSTIYNIYGRMIESFELKPGMNLISIKHYASGQYLFRYTFSNGSSFTEKIIVK